MRRFLSKSNSFRNPSFTSIYSQNSPVTHLCNNPILSNGSSQILHSGRNSSFLVRFGRVFSSGHGRNFSGLRNFSAQSRSFSGDQPERESIEYDVVIVGAGPAGLSAAIKLKQLCCEKGVDLSVCVVEKGAEVGAHILSGNVFEPRALNELLPQWKQEESPISVPVSSDKFWFLTKDRAFSLPSPVDNKGNYVISLSQLVRWMGAKAEELGVEIYPGFAASEILYDANDVVVGIGTNDMGIAKDGSKKENFQRGVALKGRITLLSEGCRGSLSEELIKKFNLREKGHGQHQTYALGIKEVWEIDEGKHKPGAVLHTLGWPLDQKTYGGSFLYHMKDRQVSIGLVVALNYRNPFLNPYEEFQRLKHHPAIKPVLDGGTVLQYGARTLNEGGFQSIPYPVFPGGALIGCSAGFLNVPKIKGTHTAMKSGVNRSLDEVKGRILGRKPLPSIREVFSEVRQEENRRRVKLNSTAPTATPENSALVSRNSRGSDKEGERKKRPWCDHCRKPWHTKETCWKLHGKPANLKKKPKGNGRAFRTTTEDSKEQSIDSEVFPFTKEQLEHLYKLFKSPQFTVNPSCSLATQGTSLGEDDGGLYFFEEGPISSKPVQSSCFEAMSLWMSLSLKHSRFSSLLFRGRKIVKIRLGKI